MSARNQAIVDDVNAAFAANNTEGFLAHCTTDVAWTMVGDRTVTGVEAIRSWMRSMNPEAPRFSVEHVSGDADTVTCYGQMTMKGKSGALEHYAYCDVYRFRGDKIAELRSYVVSTSAEAATASAV